MNYIYKITCIPNGRMYIGQRQYKGDPFEDDYFGSSSNPDFYTDLELYPNIYLDWQKEILEIIDGDKKLLDDRETYWISKWFDGGKVCYNLNPKGGGGWGHLSPEQRAATNKRVQEMQKRLKIGFYGITSEEHAEQGRRGAAIQKEIRTGACYGGTHEDHVESGKKAGTIGGARAKELGVGIFGLSPEQCSENSKKASAIGKETEKENGLCAFDPTHEWHRKGAKRSVEINKQKKTGIFSEESRKKILIKYKWYLKSTGELVYIGDTRHAHGMARRRNQVWKQGEQVS